MYTLTNFFLYIGDDRPVNLQEKLSSARDKDKYIIKEYTIGHGGKIYAKLNNFIKNVTFYQNDQADTFVIFSGKITNSEELFNEKKINNANISKNDYSKIIYNLYVKYGIEFINFIEGYYAVAICDICNDKYISIRDSLGSYPLFYSQNNNGIFISDTVSDIAKQDSVNLEFDLKSIAHYLHDKSFINQDTPFYEIRKVTIGSFVQFSLIKKEISLISYYIPKINKDNLITVQNAIDISENLLLKIIKEYIEPFDKIGILFSGGVDSLFIASFLKKITKKDIYTYTVSPYADDDEAKDAASFAGSIGTIHRNIILDGTVVKKFYHDMIRSYPTPDVGGWHIYMGTKYMNDDGVALAFSGHGAEISFGLDWFDLKYQQMEKYFGSLLNIIPDAAIRIIVKIIDNVNINKNKYSNLNNLDLLSLYMNKKLGINNWVSSKFSEKYILSLFNTELKRIESIGDMYKKYYIDSGSNDFIDQLIYARLMSFEANHAQGKNNFLSQCHGVELVLPFLDRRFVNFGLSIPNNIKYINNEYKHILVSLSKKYHNYSRKKSAFTTPYKEWHLNELKIFVDEIFLGNSISSNLLYEKNKLASLLNRYKQNANDISWSDIQSIISLDIWLSKFLKL
jgi:Asparagine synthase (glutamine-hydrolyzing)